MAILGQYISRHAYLSPHVYTVIMWLISSFYDFSSWMAYVLLVLVITVATVMVARFYLRESVEISPGG